MAARKLSEIAARLGLTLQGDDAEVIGVNTLEGAGPDEVSFLANPKYADQLAETRAGAVIVRPEHAGDVRRALISENPYQDFGRVLELFAAPQGSFSGISPLAFIHPDAELGEGVTVYPFVYIGPHAKVGSGAKLFPGVYVGENVRIGKGTTIYPNAVLMAGTHVGEGCILHAGSVLGADGFGDGTKIDNLAQIGHNVQIGRNGFIVSQVGISGSTTVGDNCTFAGQVGIAGHLHIGDNVTIGPQSGVAKDIPSDVVVGGTPTVDQRTYMRTLALMPRFPELFKRLSKLEKELEDLKGGKPGA